VSIKVEVQSTAADSLRENLRAYRQRMKEQVYQALTVLEAAIVQNIRSRSGLNVRTSKLLNSIGRSKKVRQDSELVISGEIGPIGVPYAAIQEIGGTITPKRAQALTIPLPDNTRRDGTPKITAQEAMSSGRGFIRDGIMFMRKFNVSKKSGMVTGSDLLPLFVLKKQVTIPGRPYLAPAVAQTKDQILQNFGLFLSASFSRKE
jgi:hypothetical protein